MKEEKEYAFKSRKLNQFFEAIFLFVPIGLIGLLISVSYRTPVIVVLVGAVPAYFFYMQLYAVRITSQFIRYDEGKKIVINADRNQLTLTQNDKIISICNSEVERVELYDQTDAGKFGNYNYMVIYTTDQRQILLTDFTVPLLANDMIMTKFLRKKPRSYFKKRFNYIDEQRFKLP